MKIKVLVLVIAMLFLSYAVSDEVLKELLTDYGCQEVENGIMCPELGYVEGMDFNMLENISCMVLDYENATPDCVSSIELRGNVVQEYKVSYDNGSTEKLYKRVPDYMLKNVIAVINPENIELSKCEKTGEDIFYIYYSCPYEGKQMSGDLAFLFNEFNNESIAVVLNMRERGVSLTVVAFAIVLIVGLGILGYVLKKRR